MPKLLDEIVATRGDELALADEFGRTTWSELDERTRRLINAFKGASIGPGDTIAPVSYTHLTLPTNYSV